MKSKIKLYFILLSSVFFILCSSTIYAQEKYAGSTDPVGKTFEEKANYWKNLTEEKRQELRDKANEVLGKLSPEEIKELRQKAEQFRNLSAADQARIRQNFERLKKIPPNKIEELKTRLKHFRKLPAAEKEKLRQRVGTRKNLKVPSAEEVPDEYTEETEEDLSKTGEKEPPQKSKFQSPQNRKPAKLSKGGRHR
jgi:hypothetical protein